MVYIIYLCFTIPLVLLLPLLQRQSRLPVMFMMIGATVAVSSSEINGLIQSLLGLSALELSLLVAPVTEEFLKALPVLLFAILCSDDRKKVLAISMSVGIGFAILENSYLLIGNYSTVSLGWALIRGFSTSLMHGICTFLVGCGIIFVRKQKKLFYTGIFGLLALAMTFHGAFNLLILSKWDMAGMLMPIVVYIIFQFVLHRTEIVMLLRRF